MNSIPCIVCGKAVKEIQFHDDVRSECTDIPDYDMWDGGAVAKLVCGYGSKYDGEEYTIAVCDDCIEKHVDRIVKE